jgi:hypothetical protein
MQEQNATGPAHIRIANRTFSTVPFCDFQARLLLMFPADVSYPILQLTPYHFQNYTEWGTGLVPKGDRQLSIIELYLFPHASTAPI